MKRKLKRIFYYVAGMDYIQKKIDKNRKLLNENIHVTNRELWFETMEDLFDIMTVCIWKMRKNPVLMNAARSDLRELINEHS